MGGVVHAHAYAGQWENFFSRFPQPLGFRGDVGMSGGEHHQHQPSPQETQNARYFPAPGDTM